VPAGMNHILTTVAHSPPWPFQNSQNCTLLTVVRTETRLGIPQELLGRQCRLKLLSQVCGEPQRAAESRLTVSRFSRGGS